MKPAPPVTTTFTWVPSVERRAGGSGLGCGPELLDERTAIVPAGEQARGLGLGQRGGGRVLLAQVELEALGDGERQGRVERVDAVLAARRVARGAEVEDGRAVLEGDERVAQALGEVDRPAVLGVEQDGIDGAEGRAADPDVDHDVEDGPCGARDV